MQKLLIRGKKVLSGTISISGSKNATLPILAASILAKNVKHSDTNLNGETILHLAIEKNNIMLIEKLLNLGLDINSKDNNGVTPLHLAVMKAKNMSVIEFLLKNGADKNIKTPFGETVYDLALENEILNNLNVNIKILK